MNSIPTNTENFKPEDYMISADEPILITGAAGFIGARVVQSLLDRGFRNLICFARPSSDKSRLESIIENRPAGTKIELIKGNLLSRAKCEEACKDVSVILHLAAGIGEKSYPDAFLNSVVATRNLLEASLLRARLRRFVLVSSFAVYSNCEKPQGRLLDESCPIEPRPDLRGEAYCFAKVKQEEIVREYNKNHGIPFVMVRPGAVYGSGKSEMTGRIGINTFGSFLHLGGSNTIPITYVDNCADAIVLAGIVKGIDGESFNVVDDDLPSSRQFLRLYKKNAADFKSVYVPHAISYAFCMMWEKYSEWSQGQLPPVFNRKRWHTDWKKTSYSNRKLKTRTGWAPRVSTAEGVKRYCEARRRNARND